MDMFTAMFIIFLMILAWFAIVGLGMAIWP